MGWRIDRKREDFQSNSLATGLKLSISPASSNDVCARGGRTTLAQSTIVSADVRSRMLTQMREREREREETRKVEQWVSLVTSPFCLRELLGSVFAHLTIAVGVKISIKWQQQIAFLKWDQPICTAQSNWSQIVPIIRLMNWYAFFHFTMTSH